MRIKKHVIPLLLSLFCAVCFFISCASESGSTDEKSSEPVDSEIVAASRKKVLVYLTNLSNDNATSFTGVISGQNCYHGTQILDTDYSKGYTTMVADLHKETGKWVGILGLDYEYERLYSEKELSKANDVLIDYAKEGGLITITFTPHNPWVNDESDVEGNPGTATGNSGTQSAYSLAHVESLDDLINPEKEVNSAWMRKLDRIASALQELRDAGVIVLFRPMQEMNGCWFWWGMSSHPNDPQPYINVYKHMHEYFTKDKKLNNLIWVYSPNSTGGEADAIANISSWNRNVDWAYPGDDYVDIVAGTNYSSSMDFPDYETYVTLGKPMGIAEVGPTIVDGVPVTGMDNTKIINQISGNYPRVAYWVSWHWNWSLISNEKSKELLNNSNVINRGDFDNEK